MDKLGISMRNKSLQQKFLFIIAVGSLVVSSCGKSSSSSIPTSSSSTLLSEQTVLDTVPIEQGQLLDSYIPSSGDCYDKRKIENDKGFQIDHVLLLHCDQAHTFEVFATFPYDPAQASTTTTQSVNGTELPGTTIKSQKSTTTQNPLKNFPGVEALTKQAKKLCPKAFTTWVGHEYETSSFEISYILPSESSWENSKLIGCVLSESGKLLTGTTQGTAR